MLDDIESDDLTDLAGLVGRIGRCLTVHAHRTPRRSGRSVISGRGGPRRPPYDRRRGGQQRPPRPGFTQVGRGGAAVRSGTRRSAGCPESSRSSTLRAAEPSRRRPVTGPHPLDPLTADEIRRVTAVLRRERGVARPQWRVAAIELREPAKEVVRAHRPGDPVERVARAIVWDTGDGLAYTAVVSLRNRPTRRARRCRGPMTPCWHGNPSRAASPTRPSTSGTSATRRCAAIPTSSRRWPGADRRPVADPDRRLDLRRHPDPRALRGPPDRLVRRVAARRPGATRTRTRCPGSSSWST